MIVTPADFTPLVAAGDHPHAESFVFRGEEILAREGDCGLPPAAAIDALGLEPGAFHPVGLLGERYCRAAFVAPGTAPPPGFAFTGLRNLFGNVDDRLVAVAGRARMIVEWARTHRFCGACGTRTDQADNERAKRCPSCSLTVYPRISPAMMVLVTRGRELLLGRGINFPPGRYSALAGFLEAGETIEEAVHREVLEEVNVKVDNLRYFGSQSWPFPNSLMIAFRAEYAGGELRHDPAELADAQWFTPENVPQMPPSLSIARALLDSTLAELR